MCFFLVSQTIFCYTLLSSRINRVDDLSGEDVPKIPTDRYAAMLPLLSLPLHDAEIATVLGIKPHDVSNFLQKEKREGRPIARPMLFYAERLRTFVLARKHQLYNVPESTQDSIANVLFEAIIAETQQIADTIITGANLQRRHLGDDPVVAVDVEKAVLGLRAVPLNVQSSKDLERLIVGILSDGSEDGYSVLIDPGLRREAINAANAAARTFGLRARSINAEVDLLFEGVAMERARRMKKPLWQTFRILEAATVHGASRRTEEGQLVDTENVTVSAVAMSIVTSLVKASPKFIVDDDDRVRLNETTSLLSLEDDVLLRCRYPVGDEPGETFEAMGETFSVTKQAAHPRLQAIYRKEALQAWRQKVADRHTCHAATGK